MKFKTLQHKTLPNTFGVIYGEMNPEIYQCSEPMLFGEKTTIRKLKWLYKDTTVISQLEDYDLVEVCIYIFKK